MSRTTFPYDPFWNVKGSKWGNVYEIAFPPDCNVVIVCSNDGTGLTPLCIRLPHQLYVAEFKDTKGLTLIPANSKHYVYIENKA